jgi:hypothetical protein
VISSPSQVLSSLFSRVRERIAAPRRRRLEPKASDISARALIDSQSVNGKLRKKAEAIYAV